MDDMTDDIDPPMNEDEWNQIVFRAIQAETYTLLLAVLDHLGRKPIKKMTKRERKLYEDLKAAKAYAKQIGAHKL